MRRTTSVISEESKKKSESCAGLVSATKEHISGVVRTRVTGQGERGGRSEQKCIAQ